VPYYSDLINFVLVGLWGALMYTCIMLVALMYTLDSFATEAEKTLHRERMTMVGIGWRLGGGVDGAGPLAG
jgi:hypothetical protein